MPGPIARAMLKLTLFSATAAGTSSRGTSSVTEAWKAGWRIAEPMPSVKVMTSSSQGDIQPSSSHSASASAAIITTT